MAQWEYNHTVKRKQLVTKKVAIKHCWAQIWLDFHFVFYLKKKNSHTLIPSLNLLRNFFGDQEVIGKETLNNFPWIITNINPFSPATKRFRGKYILLKMVFCHLYNFNIMWIFEVKILLRRVKHESVKYKKYCQIQNCIICGSIALLHTMALITEVMMVRWVAVVALHHWMASWVSWMII